MSGSNEDSASHLGRLRHYCYLIKAVVVLQSDDRIQCIEAKIVLDDCVLSNTEIYELLHHNCGLVAVRALGSARYDYPYFTSVV